MLTLIASLLASPPLAATLNAAGGDDPPIKVWLNQDHYFRTGDKARVSVKVTEDGYLVVLRADADGRVRVLFPPDPGVDAFVRGSRKIEVRGRGDREAFYVDEREGSGLVLAARSATPLRVDELVRGDHWDYRVLTARDTAGAADPEQALLEIVHRMVPDGRFDYDVARYTVLDARAYYDRWRYRPYSPVGLHLSFGWGRPYYRYGFGYRSCFDPFWYDPFYCAHYDPFFYSYDPFFYGRFFTVYSPYRYGYRYGGRIIYTGWGATGGLTFKDPGGVTSTVVFPRSRVPERRLVGRELPRLVLPVRARERGVEGLRSRPIVRDLGTAPARRPPEVRLVPRRDGGSRVVRTAPRGPSRASASGTRGGASWGRARPSGGGGRAAPARGGVRRR